MLGGWIEKRENLPAGIMIVDETLRPLLEEIQELSPDDLAEVKEFIGYLSGRLENPSGRDSRVSAKICDFMAGGMQRVG